jgi:AbrB family looped-hinge helix DNA binding protein
MSDIVTLSPKYQVVIPKSVREHLDILPGTKLQVIAFGRRIELIPIEPIQDLRGSLKGIQTKVIREEE